MCFAANEAAAGLALVINMNHGAGLLCLRGPPWGGKRNDLSDERQRSRKGGCEKVWWERSKCYFMILNEKQRQWRVSVFSISIVQPNL